MGVSRRLQAQSITQIASFLSRSLHFCPQVQWHTGYPESTNAVGDNQSGTFPEQEAEMEIVLNGMLVLIISKSGNFRKK